MGGDGINLLISIVILQIYGDYITLNMVNIIIKIVAFYMATETISRVVYIETSLAKFSFLPKFLKDECAA